MKEIWRNLDGPPKNVLSAPLNKTFPSFLSDGWLFSCVYLEVLRKGSDEPGDS